ncbi:MAG: undecaprenyldiphospho-muramoylpentapeptide beta-N-acetylglucosaminyltransferase [Bacteroides sp.]
MKKELKVIISGGGTGGHIFPAISIANAIMELNPDTKILFVGAEGRMEMQKVPDAGYQIIGLPIAGLDRKHLWKNIGVAIKLIRSQLKARKIINDFKPQIAVGVGGYASGPTLKTASMMGIATLIQEQNSYAGVTNKLLGKKAHRICVAYDHMDRFFPTEKLMMTGNPVRQNLIDKRPSKENALASFNLAPNKKTILIIGGSLGARTINNALVNAIPTIKNNSDIQFIWQTGKIYHDQVLNELKATTTLPNLYVTDFIKDMPAAYAAADLIISRAGAGSISEFCLLGKPVILIPSPNVAEDHQTKNAQALVDKQAALLIKDSDANQELFVTALQTVKDDETLKDLAAHISQLALPNAARMIAEEVIRIAEKSQER